VRLWFGSYLPYWRPKVDYRTTYSAQARLGGGILLDAIHELDLAVWILDDRFTVVCALLDRVGDLEIDVEDTVKALLRHADGATLELSLDYLSRRYRRGIEVVGQESTLRLDWARSVLEIEDASMLHAEEASTPVSRSYEREAEAFLAFIRGEAAPIVDGATGAMSLRLADRIRSASR
jgi:predicted dehydrogenase